MSDDVHDRGVAPTIDDALAARAEHAGVECFHCTDCGVDVYADEDGCCATCGADCEIRTSTGPHDTEGKR